jgi:hypothetical protein
VEYIRGHLLKPSSRNLRLALLGARTRRPGLLETGFGSNPSTLLLITPWLWI